MTLPAVDTWNVRGLEGPPYKVGPKCSNPTCSSGAEWTHRIHGHHIVRRSQLAGAFDWVEIDSVTHPNVCALCPRCHDRITAGETAIRLNEGQWWWSLVTAGKTSDRRFILVEPLDPHPPTLEQASAPQPHPVSGSEVCPTCGQARRRRAGDPRPSVRRRRATWGVRVPADEAEDGAAVLDTLVDDLSIVLGYDGDNARYYVLVPALAFCQMNRAQFAREIEGLAR